MSGETAFRRAQAAEERGDFAAAETAWGEAIDAGERLGEALRARALAR
ncbi:MAG: hypothetical protein HYY18_15820, partial [Planctomycetes bacterium]|nr:hypothetical protein [Planctomycetota bacterium]